MAEIQNWQKQNMKKSGPTEAAPSQGNAKLQGGVSNSLHSKIATPTFGSGGVVAAKAKAGAFAKSAKKPVYLADGGDSDSGSSGPLSGSAWSNSSSDGDSGSEVSYTGGSSSSGPLSGSSWDNSSGPSEAQFKQMGLDASNKEVDARAKEREPKYEKMGIREGILSKTIDGFKDAWDRIKAGNIDDPKSEAYNRYGAGRGRAEYDKQQTAKSAADDGTTPGIKAEIKSQSDKAWNDRNAEIKAQYNKPEYKDTEFGDLDGAMAKAAEAKDKPAATAKRKVVAAPAASSASSSDSDTKAPGGTGKRSYTPATMSASDTAVAQGLGTQYSQAASAYEKAKSDPNASEESISAALRRMNQARISYDNFTKSRGR